MENHCQKHFHRLGSILRVFLYSSIDPRLCVDRPQYEIRLVQCCRHQHHNRHLRPGLRVHALPLSLSVLILFGNMKQLAKLRMSIYIYPTSMDRLW